MYNFLILLYSIVCFKFLVNALTGETTVGETQSIVKFKNSALFFFGQNAYVTQRQANQSLSLHI